MVLGGMYFTWCCYKINLSFEYLYIAIELNAFSLECGPWLGRENVRLLLYGIHAGNTFLDTRP